jgi:hypothetical protein
MDKSVGRRVAIRRLVFAAVLLGVSFILYSISGGGPTGLLWGAISAFVNMAWIILLIAALYGLMKYR